MFNLTKSCPGFLDEFQYISEEHKLFDYLSRSLHSPQFQNNSAVEDKLTFESKPSFMSLPPLVVTAFHTLGFLKSGRLKGEDMFLVIVTSEKLGFTDLESVVFKTAKEFFCHL